MTWSDSPRVVLYSIVVTLLLEHDPEKWIPVFGKRSCSTNKIERDDDSKKSHLALALLWQIFCLVAGDFGFPNQLFSDSWVVGSWRADHDWGDSGLEERAWALAKAILGSIAA